MQNTATALDKKKKRVINQNMLLLLLIIALAIIATIVNPRFLRITNIINIFQQIAVLGIVASGVGMLLISGHIDISVGSQVSLMGVIVAMVIQRVLGLPEADVAQWRMIIGYPLAFLVTFAVGFGLGLINGIVVIYSKTASFIITLGFMTAYHGLALIVSRGASYTLYGRFELLGRGRIFDVIPVSILFFIGIVVLAHIVLKYLRFGRFLYAIGDNRKAAYVSGIKTNRVIVSAYILVGLLNALAATIMISRVGTALADTGDAYALDSLAAVVVGGIAITGGKGNAMSIFLGVVLIGLIGNALVVMNVNPFFRDVVIGLIIVAAVTINEVTAEKS
jgi:ribose transport system permease protein